MRPTSAWFMSVAKDIKAEGRARGEYVYIGDVVDLAVSRTLVSDETRVRAELAACADEILLCRVDLVETHDAEALRRSALPVRGPDGRVEDKHLVLIW